ncbi:MAG TPA: DUF255 domain-containing protein, partial [Vicinamibacterales bacterium]|nr:DUF255 domain-containing protein [Vicinamibacterales bacterium]
MTISWHDWDREAFARGAAEDRPILLSIVAAWSEGCARMDREAFADATVAARVMERFVPVRVDADLRPDVADRYALGGWPTTAFLTPEGELLGGGTYLDRPTLQRALEVVSAAFRARRAEIAALVAAAAAARDRAGASEPSAPAAAGSDDLEALCDRACGELSIVFPGAAVIELLVRAGAA